MNNKFHQSCKDKRVPILLFILSIITGIAAFIFGEAFLPLAVAPLAALFLFDNSKRSIFSIIASVLVILLNIAGTLLGLTFSLSGVCAVIIALTIAFAFAGKQNKSDSSFVATVLCGGFLIISYALLAMMIQENYTVEAVVHFYGSIADIFKDTLLDVMTIAYQSAGIQVETELLTELIDMQIYMVISYLFILAFLLVGLSYKLFGFAVGRCSTDKEDIQSWRFDVSNLYAYFYVILSFATIFINSLDSFYFVAVYNLYNIFMVIFAYIGYRTSVDLLRKKFSTFISNLMIIAALVAFSSLASQILALVGVFYTIRRNNEAKFKVV